jgi:hypothetical protein
MTVHSFVYWALLDCDILPYSFEVKLPTESRINGVASPRPSFTARAVLLIRVLMAF